MKWLPLSLICYIVGIEAKTYLFPIPHQLEWTGSGSALADQFQFQGIENKHLEKAAARAIDQIQKEKWEPVQVPYSDPVNITSNLLQGIRFNVVDNKSKLDMGIDESYKLTVPPNGGFVDIQAPTWVGALHALETFTQLVINTNGQLIAHSASIQDAPSFGHRGILLDTSRNFFPVNDILRTIDAMSYNKMNVFHWHVTDSQAWPLYFHSHPELSEKGAYSPKEVYTPSDVENILSHAEERGVRVVIEIDMPAHTASIAESYPDYVICRDKFWSLYAAEPPAGQLNPLHPGAHSLVKDIVTEATQRFPDTLYHTGGDEINNLCWESHSGVRDHLQRYQITTKQLWLDWEDKLLRHIIKDLKKRPIIWEDALKDGGSLPKETIVQIWTTPASTYTSQGHDVIVSSYDYFYFDCGHGGWVGNDPRYHTPNQKENPEDAFNYGGGGGSWCSPYKTWQRIYSYDMNMDIPADSPGKILGGEVAMWSEQTGPSVLDGRLWPRAAAAAEIYWSGNHDKQTGVRRTVKEVSPRFYDWVYRLQSRGIAAEPVQPKWCARHPGECDLNEA